MNKKICSDKVIWGRREPAVLEGSIPLPSGVNDLVSVLSICGFAEVEDVSCAGGVICIRGTARFTVLYSAGDGEPDSFDAECSFEHSADIQDAVDGMTLSAVAEPTWINCRPDGGLLKLSSEIMIDIAGFHTVETEILVPEINAGVEYDLRESNASRNKLRCVKCYSNNELRIPQTMPELQKLLFTDGCAVVNSIKPENGRAAIEGELKLFIAYLSNDKNAPLQFMSDTLSYGEVISDPEINEDSVINVIAVPERISAEPENDVLQISSVISLCVLITSEEKTEYVSDMYSLSANTCVKRGCVPSSEIIPVDSVKKVLRSTLTIPETYPEASRMLISTSCAEITGAVYENGRLNVDGIIHYALCYTTQESGLKSITLKEPFDEEIPVTGLNENTDITVKAYSDYTAASGSGREIAVKTCLEFIIFAKRNRDFCPVICAEFSEATPRQGGMTVYYADGNETLFDIARKNRVAKSCLTCLDGEKELPDRGSRLLIIK